MKVNPRRMMAVHSAFKKAETTPSMRRREISVKSMKGNPTNTNRRVNVCLSLNRAAARVRLKKDTTKARLCILTDPMWLASLWRSAWTSLSAVSTLRALTRVTKLMRRSGTEHTKAWTIRKVLANCLDCIESLRDENMDRYRCQMYMKSGDGNPMAVAARTPSGLA